MFFRKKQNRQFHKTILCICYDNIMLIVSTYGLRVCLGIPTLDLKPRGIFYIKIKFSELGKYNTYKWLLKSSRFTLLIFVL